MNVPISMEGKLVVLRPASQGDASIFYEWRIDAADLHMWATQRRLPSFEEFGVEFQSFYLSNLTLVVGRKLDGALAGFVQAYGINLEQGWASILVNIAPPFRSPGIAIEAAYLLLRFLYEQFPIRKVYAEVFEYNAPSRGLLRKFGFVEEGRSKRHVWYRDRYWDMIRMALYRGQWSIAPERLDELLGRFASAGSKAG